MNIEEELGQMLSSLERAIAKIETESQEILESYWTESKELKATTGAFMSHGLRNVKPQEDASYSYYYWFKNYSINRDGKTTWHMLTIAPSKKNLEVTRKSMGAMTRPCEYLFNRYEPQLAATRRATAGCRAMAAQIRKYSKELEKDKKAVIRTLENSD